MGEFVPVNELGANISLFSGSRAFVPSGTSSQITFASNPRPPRKLGKYLSEGILVIFSDVRSTSKTFPTQLYQSAKKITHFNTNKPNCQLYKRYYD